MTMQVAGSDIQLPDPEANRIRNSSIVAPAGSRLIVHPSALIENSRILLSPGGDVEIGKNSLIRGSNIEARSGTFRIGSHAAFIESIAKIRNPRAVLSIGDCSRINARTIFHVDQSILVGDYCLFAADCLVADTQVHSLEWQERRREIDSWVRQAPSEFNFKSLRSAPLIVESDCWIGRGASILVAKSGASELKVGGKSIIGAGAVVKESIPQLSIAVGVPAKVVRSLA